MAATKKTQPGAPSALRVWGGVLVSLACGPVGATVLLTGVLVGAWMLVWHFFGESLLRSDRYVLRQENLDVTPMPPWIHTDVRGEVFRSIAFDGPLTIMDDHLTRRVADGFALHPWVAKVRRVVKQYPARVKVDLDYRRPVCMVEVPGGLFPVDMEGVWLRSEDFSPIEASQYPRLSGLDSMPVGSVGTKWGDGRVVGAAEIATLLFDAWSELQLARIVPSSRPQAGVHYAYDLYTRGGTRILWGLAPGAGLAGDVSAAEKLERLRKFYAARGTLDGPHQLDVRSLRGIEILPAMAR
jgi:hypothetical protein